MSNVTRFPKAKPDQGMLDIYRASQGMRGLDALLPIELADRIIEMIKAAAVPVRYEAPEDFAVIEMRAN